MCIERGIVVLVIRCHDCNSVSIRVSNRQLYKIKRRILYEVCLKMKSRDEEEKNEIEVKLLRIGIIWNIDTEVYFSCQTFVA